MFLHKILKKKLSSEERQSRFLRNESSKMFLFKKFILQTKGMKTDPNFYNSRKTEN
jgi:hypothetical protein